MIIANTNCQINRLLITSCVAGRHQLAGDRRSEPGKPPIPTTRWAGIDLKPISLELTYGLERIAMYLQEVDNVFALQWCKGISCGEIHHMDEVEFSKLNFDHADTDLLMKQFEAFEKESIRLNKLGLVLPSYELCLKCSHSFNLLDARGAISVTERTAYIARVRNLARLCAKAFSQQREEMNFPLLNMNSR